MSIIEVLNYTTSQLNRYAALFIFLFGVVGNFLNILVFSQRAFRTNSCAWLLLMVSIADLIAIPSGLTTEILDGWATDPANNNDWICKLRVFFTVTSKTISSWLMVLATIDRWFLSSIDARRRQRSSLRNAQQWSIVIIIVSILLYLQLYYCYAANLIGTPKKCYAKTTACRLTTDLSFAGITVAIPIILMILFGLLTVSNLHQSHRRIQANHLDSVNHSQNNLNGGVVVNLERRTLHKTNHSLLRMLLVQVSIFTIFTMPLSIQRFYVSLSTNNNSTALAIQGFLYNLFLIITFIAVGAPFYIYAFLGGTLFRKALYNLLLSMKQKTLRR